MATYKGIKGFTIQSLASDPSATANTEGQVWYNTTSSALKGSVKVAGVGSWASANALNTARRNLSGIGSQAAALVVGGQSPPAVGATETYDGSSWSEEGDLTTPRTLAGPNMIGTQAAGQIQGGQPFSKICEQWNGTSWSEEADLLANRNNSIGAGTTTAGLCYGGAVSQPTNTAAVEEWNGTSWSETNNINTMRRYVAGGGTQTAAILYAGTPYTGATEIWNGSSWTTSPGTLNTPRQYGCGIVGTSATTSALMVGGYENVPVDSTTTKKVEQWDGSSWTEVADIATVRGQMGGSSVATTTAGLVAGGSPVTGVVEEWTVAAATYGVKTFTLS